MLEMVVQNDSNTCTCGCGCVSVLCHIEYSDVYRAPSKHQTQVKKESISIPESMSQHKTKKAKRRGAAHQHSSHNNRIMVAQAVSLSCMYFETAVA